MTVTLRLALLLPLARSLTVYDCESTFDVQPISSDNLQCPNYATDFTSNLIQIQMIARKSLLSISTAHCSIGVTITEYYNEQHHPPALFATKAHMHHYKHLIGKEQCRQIHKSKQFKIFGKTITGLAINTTSIMSINLAETSNGHLQSPPNMLFANEVCNENTTAFADITILLKTKTVKFIQGSTTIGIASGVNCNYLAEYCADEHLGEVTWHRSTHTTCDNVEFIFMGSARLFRPRKRTDLDVQLLVIDTPSRLVILQLFPETTVCGQQVHLTEHPDIEVMFMPYLSSAQIEAHNPQNKLTHFPSSLVFYSEVSTGVTDMRTKTGALTRRCTSRLYMLKYEEPWKHDLGFVYHVREDLAVLFHCLPREAQIRHSERCYEDLPIKMGRENRYMDPFSRIARSRGRKIACNTGVHGPFVINDEFIRFTPHPVHLTVHELGEMPIIYRILQMIYNTTQRVMDKQRNVQTVKNNYSTVKHVPNLEQEYLIYFNIICLKFFVCIKIIDMIVTFLIMIRGLGFSYWLQF